MYQLRIQPSILNLLWSQVQDLYNSSEIWIIPCFVRNRGLFFWLIKSNLYNWWNSLIIQIMSYTLNMFNSGQVTLPKKWREQFATNKFIARAEGNRLVIEPINTLNQWDRSIVERDVRSLIEAENITDGEDNSLICIGTYVSWDRSIAVETKYGSDIYFSQGLSFDEFESALVAVWAQEDTTLIHNEKV